jgi:hypothetical protein
MKSSGMLRCVARESRRFGGIGGLHHQGDNNLLTTPKRRSLQEPNSVISQKRTFFKVATVKTSNLT